MFQVWSCTFWRRFCFAEDSSKNAWFSYYLQTIMASRFKDWTLPWKLFMYAYETQEIQSLHQNELFSIKENIDRFCNVLFWVVGERFNISCRDQDLTCTVLPKQLIAFFSDQLLNKSQDLWKWSGVAELLVKMLVHYFKRVCSRATTSPGYWPPGHFGFGIQEGQQPFVSASGQTREGLLRGEPEIQGWFLF